jgi:ABC-2 type transport system permease protein
MKSLRYIWFIALKDLTIFVRDRASLFFFIVFPFMFMFLFNFLMQGVGGEDERLEIHLATLEPAGGLSHQILSFMETKDEASLKPGDPIIIWEKDYNAARQAVNDGELEGFLTFPADFSQAVMAAESPAKLEIYADAGAVNTRAVLNGVASMISSQIGVNRVIIGATRQLMEMNGATQEEIMAASGKIQSELFAEGTGEAGDAYLTYRIEKVGEVEAENPANFVVPGYLVMFVFFAAAVAAESIVKERQNNTLERLLATSVSKESILGGIYTGSVVKGLIQIIIFWGVGILVFKVDMGLSPAAVIILSILMVIMSSAFAIMLATLVRTVRSAASLAVLTALLLAPLGGCWWPSFVYPEWLQNVAKITPHAWATEGFNKLLIFGADFGDVWSSMVALLVFAAIFGIIGIWRFRTSAV